MHGKRRVCSSLSWLQVPRERCLYFALRQETKLKGCSGSKGASEWPHLGECWSAELTPSTKSREA